MMGHDLWLDIRSGPEGISDPTMCLLAMIPQQRRIDGSLHECMFEPINGGGRLAATVGQSG
jgi:hypothetical protein